MMNRDIRQVRSVASSFNTREDDGKLYIEGYFAVFNSNYEIWDGMTESVAKGAFERSLKDGDIRALVNHDTTLVLGRTKAGTLSLREDEKGLFGTIRINPNDSAAMDLYERVSRGDVDGCSFGFNIRKEESEVLDNGYVHWTILDVDLFEVSCCTFPAYEETNIEARTRDAGAIRARSMEAWREAMMKKLKGEE
jgi:HK97 family phage prohead protease